MPQVGMAEASRLTHRNQSTIHRAMKAGRLAYTIGPNGERQVDTAELDRAFGVSARNIAPNGESQSAHVVEIALLRGQLDDRDASIRDLRSRLDASEAERRTTQAQLTALLTDQRTAAPMPTSRWSRFLAWRRGR